jgi:methyltransferase (TIGR00027 family)
MERVADRPIQRSLDIAPSQQAASARPAVACNSGAGISGLVCMAPTAIATNAEPPATSRTAIFAAMGRAEQAIKGAKAGLPSNAPDTLVRKLIPLPWRLALLPLVRSAIRNRVMSGFPGAYGHVYARTCYFDDAVKAAIKGGATQVVILGAGFDTRGVRLKAPGVTTFEVDLPGTQSTKIKRLDAVGYDRSSIRFVPLDLNKSTLTESLVSKGFDRTAKTCVIAEGLTFYIDAAAVRSILDFVKRDCGQGSVLAFDTIDDATASGTTTDPDGIKTIATVRKNGEPFLFGVKRGPGETAKLVQGSGLTLVEDLTPRAIEQRYGLDKAKHPDVRVAAIYGIHLARA